MRMFVLGGLVRQSVDLVTHVAEGVFVLVVQGLVRDGNEESMAPVFLVPSVVPQFSGVEKLSAGEETFQVQNETKIVLQRLHVGK